MPLRAGERHAGGRSICFLILLNVVLFSTGVIATQEENKVIHEEQPAEVRMKRLSSLLDNINVRMFIKTINVQRGFVQEVAG